MAANDGQQLEQQMLGALLHAPPNFIELQLTLGKQPFAEPQLAAAYQAAMHLLAQGAPINPFTVAEKTGQSSAMLVQLQQQAAGLDEVSLLSLAQIVRRRADDRADRTVYREVGELFDVPSDDRSGRLLLAAEMLLSRMDEHSGYRNPGIQAINDRLDANIALMAAGDMVGPTSGLDWIDKRTAGLEPGTVWTIAGPYKGRKTSLLLNVAMNACRAGASGSLFALEGSQNKLTAHLRAMIATRKLIEWREMAQCVLGPVFVMRGRRTPAQAQALEEARVELNNYNLRIYDAKDNIFNIDVVRALVRRDRMLHDLNFFSVDFMQLLGADHAAGIYDVMQTGSRLMQRTAGEQGVTALLLAQLTEGAVSAMEQLYDDPEKKTHAPGVAGGGGLPAASDYLFMTNYKAAVATQLNVMLWLSRYAGEGQVVFEINPHSGLILGQVPGRR